MKKPVPPKIEKFPAAKQRRLDLLLEKNSAGTITLREKEKLQQLVAEAEELMIANARRWRQRAVGQRLDALGPAYRLARTKQARAERLLAARAQRSLIAKERQELKSLLREADAITLRRAAALDAFMRDRTG